MTQFRHLDYFSLTRGAHLARRKLTRVLIFVEIVFETQKVPEQRLEAAKEKESRAASQILAGFRHRDAHKVFVGALQSRPGGGNRSGTFSNLRQHLL